MFGVTGEGDKGHVGAVVKVSDTPGLVHDGHRGNISDEGGKEGGREGGREGSSGDEDGM